MENTKLIDKYWFSLSYYQDLKKKITEIENKKPKQNKWRDMCLEW